MPAPPLMLPLDPTGSVASNLVINEIHAIGPVGIRAFPLDYGPFFRASLSIADLSTNQPLVEGTQYYPTQMDVDASMRCGQEIDAVVIVIDPAAGARLSVTYQALGGPQSLSQAALQTAVTNIRPDDGPVSWSEVTTRPARYPPAPHQHLAGDLYGLEYIVAALNRLTLAIQVGQGGALGQLQDYAQAVVAEIVGSIAQANDSLLAHETDYTNPHKTTAAQIGAYTTEQTTAAIGVEAANQQSADATIAAQLGAHETDYHDPHDVTANQLGAYSCAQSDAAMAAMQAALTQSIVANEAIQNGHIGNFNNPHQDTAALVGTWTPQQVTGAATNAATSTQAQLTGFENAMNSHIALTNNPHQDTAANIGTWTYTQIVNGIVTPYSGHAANQNNPHNVTVAQLGTYSAATINGNISAAFSTIVSEVNGLDANFASHTGNTNNPHQDNVNNTGGAYSAAYLQSLINTLTPPR